MFEKFTENAIIVIMLAQTEARRQRFNHVATEHILLGLVGEQAGIAGVALRSLGLSLSDVRSEVEKLCGYGPGGVAVEIPFTDSAKLLLQESWHAHKIANVQCIDSEHLLLGLLAGSQSDDAGLKVLRNLKIEVATLLDAIGKSASLMPTPDPDHLSRPVRWADANVRNPIVKLSELRHSNKFTADTITALTYAEEQRIRLGHNYVGTELMLLGLIAERNGIAGRTLRSVGLNLKDTQNEVEKIIGRGSGFLTVDAAYSPRALQVIEAASVASGEMGQDRIATEHVLLGLLQCNESVARTVLENFELDFKLIENRAKELMKDDDSPGALIP